MGAQLAIVENHYVIVAGVLIQPSRAPTASPKLANIHYRLREAEPWRSTLGIDWQTWPTVHRISCCSRELEKEEMTETAFQETASWESRSKESVLGTDNRLGHSAVLGSLATFALVVFAADLTGAWRTPGDVENSAWLSNAPRDLDRFRKYLFGFAKMSGPIEQ